MEGEVKNPILDFFKGYLKGVGMGTSCLYLYSPPQEGDPDPFGITLTTRVVKANASHPIALVCLLAMFCPEDYGEQIGVEVRECLRKTISEARKAP